VAGFSTLTRFIYFWGVTHVAPDLNAFTSYTPYSGSDKLCVGDGKGLNISHIVSSSLFTFSAPLQLHDILHVLEISKPLLSIS
jgi:hypothetical protein